MKSFHDIILLWPIYRRHSSKECLNTNPMEIHEEYRLAHDGTQTLKGHVEDGSGTQSRLKRLISLRLLCQ